MDLILELVHHVAVFGVVGVVTAEFFLVTPGLGGARLATVGRLDIAYGVLAGIIVVAGFLRVFLGDAGPAFYLGNWIFWTKIALFVVVGLLSIQPTVQIIRWRRAAGQTAGYTVPAESIGTVRRFFLAEFAVLLFIPVFAALMARGIGL